MLVITQYMHDHNDIGIRVMLFFFGGRGGGIQRFNNLFLKLISYPMNLWYNEKKEKNLLDCRKKHEKKRYTI